MPFDAQAWANRCKEDPVERPPKPTPEELERLDRLAQIEKQLRITTGLSVEEIMELFASKGEKK